jgi:hypothetical protein
MPKQILIPNYGWVPFPYFQHILIIVLIISYSYYKKINKKLNKNIYDKVKNKPIKYYFKLIISLIPIFIILYLDLAFSSFSMNNLGITNYVPNEIINSILKLFGAYCLIQVAAQDIGIKTGEVQGEFFKIPALQFFIYTGVAFSLTQNRSMAIIGALLYFQMKYFVSENITKDVCFE